MPSNPTKEKNQTEKKRKRTERRQKGDEKQTEGRTYLLAQGDSHLVGNTASDRGGGDPPGLRAHHHPSLFRPARLVQVLRYLYNRPSVQYSTVQYSVLEYNRGGGVIIISVS